MSNSTIKHQIASIALIGLFIASAAMIGSVGARESFTVIFSPEDVNSETNATYGVTPATSTTKEVKINITDRVVMAGAIICILVGLGVVTVSSKDPKIAREFVKWYPMLVAGIAIMAAGDTITSVFDGTWDWNANSDFNNAEALFVTSSAVAAGASLAGVKKSL